MQLIDPICLHFPIVPQSAPLKKAQKAIKLRVKFSCELFHLLFIVENTCGKVSAGSSTRLTSHSFSTVFADFFFRCNRKADPERHEPYFCKPHMP